MYYVYRHIRLDKNVPFYIGIGTVNPKGRSNYQRYSRAFNKVARSDVWKRIAHKVEFRVEIFYESTNKQEILDKEIEFIKLYGRMDQNSGSLVNLTNGGTNIINSLNKKSSEKRLRNCKKIRVYQYSLDGDFIKKYESLSEALRPLKSVSTCALKRSCEKNTEFLGYKWFLEFKGFKIAPYTSYLIKIKKKITLSKDEQTLKFNSIKEAAKFLSTSPSFIRKVLKNPRTTVRGFHAQLS